MGEMVLVVDDDIGVQATLARILEDEGYAVALAADGIEALERLSEVTPSVILLDLGMPRLDGFGFVDELQRRGVRSRYRVIVLTADGRARQKAEQVGAEGCVAKPFDLLTLVEEVERVVG